MECSYGCLSNFDLPPPDSPSGRNKLDSTLKTLPGGISGRERPHRGGWQVRAHVNPPRCRTRYPEVGVAPATAAPSGTASPLQRPWCNRNAATDMRNRWRAHGSGVFVHMHPDVDVHARYATDPRRSAVRRHPLEAGSNVKPYSHRSSLQGADRGTYKTCRGRLCAGAVRLAPWAKLAKTLRCHQTGRIACGR